MRKRQKSWDISALPLYISEVPLDEFRVECMKQFLFGNMDTNAIGISIINAHVFEVPVYPNFFIVLTFRLMMMSSRIPILFSSRE